MSYDPKHPPGTKSPPAEAVRVGDELRTARLALGISQEEMADRLRISRRYLNALEKGRAGDLPGLAYGIGFVRSYAQAMGLDAPDLVRRFREAAGGQARGKDLVFPEPVPERGVPTGAIIIFGAVLAIGAYAGWYRWSGSAERSVDAVPPLPPRLEQAAREAGQPPLPEPPAPSAVVTPPAQGSAPAVPSPGGGTAGNAPQAGSAPAAGPRPEAAPSTPGTVPLPRSTGSTASPAGIPLAPAPPPIAPTPAEPAATGIVLRATQDSWIQIRDSRGRVVFSRLLREGESYEVPQTPGLLLTTGRIEALRVEVDGAPSPAFAEQIGVRRDIPLDPARLRAAAPGQLPTR